MRQLFDEDAENARARARVWAREGQPPVPSWLVLQQKRSIAALDAQIPRRKLDLGDADWRSRRWRGANVGGKFSKPTWPESYAQRTLDAPHFVVVCFLLALGLRLCLVLLAAPRPLSDFAWYYQRAASLAQGHGFAVDGVPTAYWPVGYPGFLALFFALFGTDPAVARALNLPLAAVILWTSYRLAAHLFGSERVGRLTLAVLAFYPLQWAYCCVLTSEQLVTALTLTGAWLLRDETSAGERLRRPLPWRWLLSGLIWGAAILTKPQSALLLPVAALFAGRGWQFPRWRPSLQRLAIASCVAACVVVPWSWRNRAVLGGSAAVSTNGGINLYVGNNPTATGGYRWPDPPDPTILVQADEIGRDHAAGAVAMRYMRAHPWHFLRMAPRKWRMLYARDDDVLGNFERGLEPLSAAARSAWHAFVLVNWAYYLAILLGALLAWVGAIVAVLRKRTNRLSRHLTPAGLVVTALTSATYAVFFGSPRFHYPLMPWFAMYVAWGIASRLGPEVGEPTAAADAV